VHEQHPRCALPGLQRRCWCKSGPKGSPTCWWRSGPKGGRRHNSPLSSLSLSLLPRRVLLLLALRRKIQKLNNTKGKQGNT
jgi:hypothetical protein